MMEFFGEREDMLHRDESESVSEMSPATLHLIEEHEKFRAKMASWRKALLDTQSDEQQNILSEIVAFLDNDVEFHARKEDEAYFPALEPYHSTMLMYEAHNLIREESAAFKAALERWKRGEVPFSKVQNALERVFTLLNDHFGEEELVYFPIAEQKWSEEEKSEVWAKMQALTL
ncbi:MAG: hemerythrin domain-containing protein [Armatimonadota bacterium]